MQFSWDLPAELKRLHVPPPNRPRRFVVIRPELLARQVAHLGRDFGFVELAAVGVGDLLQVPPAGDAGVHPDSEGVDWEVARASIEQEADFLVALNATVAQ